MSQNSKPSATPASTQKKSSKRRESSQSQRFINFAREVGADESAEGFERVFAKIVPPKKEGDKAPPHDKDDPKT